METDAIIKAAKKVLKRKEEESNGGSSSSMKLKHLIKVLVEKLEPLSIDKITIRRCIEECSTSFIVDGKVVMLKKESNDRMKGSLPPLPLQENHHQQQ